MASSTINYSIDLLQREAGGRPHIQRALSTVRDRFSVRGKSVVDIGCGVGANLGIFADGNSLVGIEGLEEAAATARARGFRVLDADLERGSLPLGDESVDVALCIDVLEHIANAELLGRDVVRVLRPGGLFVLNVPNHFDLVGRLRILRGSGLDVHGYFPESEDWNNPHVRFFTQGGAYRYMTALGLDVVADLSRQSTVDLLKMSDAYKPTTIAKHVLLSLAPRLALSGFFLVGRRKGAQRRSDEV